MPLPSIRSRLNCGPSELNVPLMCVCAVISCEFSSFRSSRQNSMKTSWKSSGPSQTTLLLGTTARASPPFCGWVCGWLRHRPGLRALTLASQLSPCALRICQSIDALLSSGNAVPTPAHSPVPSVDVTFSHPLCFSKHTATWPAPEVRSSPSLEWLVQREAGGPLPPSMHCRALVPRPFGLRTHFLS